MRDRPKVSINQVTSGSMSEMDEVRDATGNKIKKREPKIMPPVILPKATGKV